MSNYFSRIEFSSIRRTQRFIEVRRKFQYMARFDAKFIGKVFTTLCWNSRRISMDLCVWLMLTNSKLEKYPDISSRLYLYTKCLQNIIKYFKGKWLRKHLWQTFSSNSACAASSSRWATARRAFAAAKFILSGTTSLLTA